MWVLIYSCDLHLFFFWNKSFGNDRKIQQFLHSWLSISYSYHNSKINFLIGNYPFFFFFLFFFFSFYHQFQYNIILFLRFVFLGADPYSKTPDYSVPVKHCILSSMRSIISYTTILHLWRLGCKERDNKFIQMLDQVKFNGIDMEALLNDDLHGIG